MSGAIRAFQAIAADNLLLDRPLDTRRQDVTALHQSLGTCAPDGDIDAENWLRGSFKLTCTEGWLRVTFTLAPTSAATGAVPVIRGGPPDVACACRCRATAGVGNGGFGR